MKVTAYVKVPAFRDTLAEKHVTKFLKCFTISAALCITGVKVSNPSALQLIFW
jgi:hypothetical protein